VKRTVDLRRCPSGNWSTRRRRPAEAWSHSADQARALTVMTML
jgi:hypothetical protein